MSACIDLKGIGLIFSNLDTEIGPSGPSAAMQTNQEIKACLEIGFLKKGEVPQTPEVNEGEENAMKASNTSDIFKANSMPEPTEPVMTTIMAFWQRRRQITLAEQHQAQAQLTATTTTSQPGQPQSTTQKGTESGSSATMPDSTSGTVDTRWQLYNSVRRKKAVNE